MNLLAIVGIILHIALLFTNFFGFLVYIGISILSALVSLRMLMDGSRVIWTVAMVAPAVICAIIFGDILFVPLAVIQGMASSLLKSHFEEAARYVTDDSIETPDDIADGYSPGLKDAYEIGKKFHTARTGRDW